MHPRIRDLLRTRPVGLALGAANQLDLLVRCYGGTDKREHGYLPYYERHLGPTRMRISTVLEIGIGSPEDYSSSVPGGSLCIWRDYFPRATIGALDIVPKVVNYGSRVKVYQADQSSELDLTGVADQLGPLDVVIDDGSHVGTHQALSFRTLFPRVKAGGWYIIEDLSTSYYPSHGGGIPAPASSAVGLLRELVEDVQINDLTFKAYPGWGAPPPHRFPEVGGLSIYPGIVFVKKTG